MSNWVDTATAAAIIAAMASAVGIFSLVFALWRTKARTTQDQRTAEREFQNLVRWIKSARQERDGGDQEARQDWPVAAEAVAWLITLRHEGWQFEKTEAGSHALAEALKATARSLEAEADEIAIAGSREAGSSER